MRGSDAAAIRTKAVRDGDYYVINGQKTFITNGTFADIIVLACKIDLSRQPEEEDQSIAVEGESLQYVKRQSAEKMGRHATDTTELFFEDCRVPVGNLFSVKRMKASNT